MLGEGRVYGGGLHKLEPKELGNVGTAAIAELLPPSARPQEHKQGELFETGLAQMRWKRRKFTMVKR